MVKSRIVILLALITLLLTSIAGAARADQVSPKEMLLERVRNSQSNYFNISRGVEGTFVISLKDMKGWEGSGVPDKSLEGSGLKVDGSLNTLQEKLHVGITGTYDNRQYGGSLYIDGNKVIFTKDSLEAVLSVNPSLLKGVNPDSINQYIYTSIPEAEELWAALRASDPQKFLPAYREILLFLLEAVPDKYFTYSGGMIVFSLDNEGLEEVITSIMLKVVLEQDRFNDLIVELLMIADPSRSREELKEEIGGAFSGLSASGDNSPVDLGEIKEALEIIDLEKFVVEISPEPAGAVSTDLDVGVSHPDFPLRLVLNSDKTGSRAAGLKSGYSMVLTLDSGTDFMKFSYTGEYSQKGGVIKEEDTLTANLRIEGKEASATALINIDMRENSSARVDIPALNGANSTDLDSLTAAAQPPAGAAPVSVFLDGKPMKFDVPPYMRGGRVMVPVRSLAEALGYGVAWREPNQVIITRNDFTVIMYVNERQYTSNGQKMWMDIPPEVQNGRNMVPLRFIVEEMGCSVKYDDISGRVDVYTGQ